MITRPLYDFLRSLMLPLKEINESIPKNGKIVDLGCGQGTVARFLAQTKTRQVTGVDNNEKRVPQADQNNLQFIVADIRKYDLAGNDAFVISDVLHHMNFEDQKKLLRKIAFSLKKEGVLTIKEIDAGEFVRSKLTRLWDFILYPKDKIYFNSAGELQKLLQSLDFKVTVTRPCRLFPGSTTLFVCTKS